MSIYYVSAASGSDTDDGSTEALAWLTIDHAMNTVVAGDHVYVKNDGNYNELATIDTTGTVAAPIVFEGYASVTGDNGVATIHGQSSRANGVTTTLTAGTNTNYVFKNIRITGHTGTGFLAATDNLQFIRCKFDTNGSSGCSCRSSTHIQCEYSNNTLDGSISTGSSTLYYAGCRFYRNGRHGVNQATGNLYLFACEFFSNVTNNILFANGTLLTVINCTIDGDGNDSDAGIATTTGNGFQLLINNVIYDCVTGISNAVAQGVENYASIHNLVNANGTPYTNASTLEGEITSAPEFHDEANNDYRPGFSSPLLSAGFDANKIEGF
jgi:hypothetical protein